MSAALVPLIEYATSAGRKLTVDRDKGVISRVKVLGEASANLPPNNNIYPRETRERAAPLIEGARVYIDHAPLADSTRPRSYRDAFGVLRNIGEGGDGLYADYHFPPKHPLAESLFWDAEHAPDRLGFSINTNGRIVHRDGKNLVEEIAFNPRTDSVDLVSRPATTRGLREHLEGQPVKKKLSELIESLKGTRPGYVKALREMAEAGIMSPDAVMDEPAPAPAATEDADHETALKAGFRGAIVAVLDDDALDMKGKLSKIKEIMKAEEKLMSGGKEEPKSEPPTEEKKTEESLKVVNQLREEMTVRDLVDEAKLTFKKPEARKAFIASLVPLAEAQRKALIAEHAETTAQRQQPRSAAPWQEPAPAKTGAGGTGTTQPVQESLTDDARAKRVQQLRAIR